MSMQVYDHDGNVLQKLDDVAVMSKIKELLPDTEPEANKTQTKWRVVDLGRFKVAWNFMAMEALCNRQKC